MVSAEIEPVLKTHDRCLPTNRKAVTIYNMSSSTASPRNPLTLPQIITIFLGLVALFVLFGLSKNSTKLQQVSADQATIQAELNIEETRAVQLQATLTYHESDDSILDHIVIEDGQLAPGEIPISSIMVTQQPEQQIAPPPTPDPALSAQRWQFWWQLLTDAPPPGSE